MDPKRCFLVIDCCGNIIVTTMEGQAKCAKVTFVSFFRYLGKSRQG